MSTRELGKNVGSMAAKYKNPITGTSDSSFHCIFTDIRYDFFYFLLFSIVIAGLFYVKEKWRLKAVVIVLSVATYVALSFWISLSVDCL
jgi:hypothetical protein